MPQHKHVYQRCRKCCLQLACNVGAPWRYRLASKVVPEKPKLISLPFEKKSEESNADEKLQTTIRHSKIKINSW